MNTFITKVVPLCDKNGYFLKITFLEVKLGTF